MPRDKKSEEPFLYWPIVEADELFLPLEKTEQPHLCISFDDLNKALTGNVSDSWSKNKIAFVLDLQNLNLGTPEDGKMRKENRKKGRKKMRDIMQQMADLPYGMQSVAPNV